MTRAGFGSSQIINAASEIIHQLSGNLQRHSKRINREVTEHSDKKAFIAEWLSRGAAIGATACTKVQLFWLQNPI